MSIQDITFRLSGNILSLTENFQEYTPPANSTVKIVSVVGEGAYTVNSEIRVVWDYGGGNPEILWSMRGSSKFNNTIEIDSSKTDGVKKLALVVDNGELDSLSMSGYMAILVESDE